MPDDQLRELLFKAASAGDDATTIKVLLHGILTIQARIEERLGDIEGRQTELTAGFVGGDMEGHRRAHQAMIDRTEEIRKLRMAIMEKTLSGVVWSGVCAVGAALWYWFIHRQVRG